MSDVLIITGPTASGKTALSELIAKNIPSEIINADVGQFYTPLSIGTAKPDLSSLFYPAHGFNFFNEPHDLTVVVYRDFVVNLINKIKQRGKLPIIVGGSLFYIKSLFFPPIEPQFVNSAPIVGSNLGVMGWEYLHEIDPARAEQIHQNDNYRIQRALAIWQATGIKPSIYKPVFNPPFKAVIMFVCPERDILNQKIKKRIDIMIKHGWLEETEKLVGTEWELFLQKKGLIGYPETIDWIKQGKNSNTIEQVIKTIELRTIAYAKRQVTFWKSFVKQLENASACSMIRGFREFF